MTLNKQKGNMYPFVTHTWNPIKGKCPHDCSYCYMKRFPQGELRLDEKCFKDDLGENNFIFVGSSCDMWADKIPSEWIAKTLKHCKKYNNKYLFQTKNPGRYVEKISNFKVYLSKLNNIILGTTIETNREDLIAHKAPPMFERYHCMKQIKLKKMVTIEPIHDFDLVDLVDMIKEIMPEWVNIGADSKGHNLPEPSKEKVKALIKELKKFTEVKIKDNMKRLL